MLPLLTIFNSHETKILKAVAQEDYDKASKLFFKMIAKHNGSVLTLNPALRVALQPLWMYYHSDSIAKRIASNSLIPITKLILDKCQLTSYEIKGLACIIHSKTLRTINLKHSGIASNALEYLAVQFDKLGKRGIECSITHLDLSYNAINYEASATLVKMVAFQPGLTVNISHNQIKVQGFVSLARALEQSPSKRGNIVTGHIGLGPEHRQIRADFIHVKGLFPEPRYTVRPGPVNIFPYTEITPSIFPSKFGMDGTVTPYICALMSNSAYLGSRDPRLPAEWEQIRVSGLNNSGYRGIAFKRNNVIVIAHRGTIGNLQNGFTDLMLAFGILSSENSLVAKKSRQKLLKSSLDPIKFSRSIRNKYPGCDILDCGHSLGGVFAAIGSFVFGNKSVTFDAPGLQDLLSSNAFIKDVKDYICLSLPAQERELSFNFEPARHLSFVSSPNAVNTLGRPIGKDIGHVIRIYTHHFLASPSGISPTEILSNFIVGPELSSHSLENFIAAMNSDESGEPMLQRRVAEWPTSSQYGKFMLSKHFKKQLWKYRFYASSGQELNANRLCEGLFYGIGGFSVTNFIIPASKMEDPDPLTTRFRDFYKSQNNAPGSFEHKYTERVNQATQ